MKYSNISIAGLICTGKSTLRKELAKELGWNSFSAGEIFREYAQKHKLKIESGDEQEKIGREVDSMINKRLRKEKEIIVDSWIAGVLGKDIPHLYKILLVCDDNERIKRFAQRESVSKKHAREKIKQRENNIYKILEEMYDIDDILDPNHYNIVIDTTKLSTDDIVKKVLKNL